MLVLIFILIFISTASAWVDRYWQDEWRFDPSRGDPCLDVMKVTPRYTNYCYNVATLVDIVDLTLNVYKIGDNLTIATDFTKLHGICKSYEGCVKGLSFCSLPDRNVRNMCAKLKILDSPYASCLRDIRTGLIPVNSSDITSLAFDFSADGMIKKCIFISHPHEVMQQLTHLCGNKAAEAFSAYRKLLSRHYNCGTGQLVKHNGKWLDNQMF